MDRRAFLSILAGSPLIFGLREILAQDAGKPADGKAVPEWYQAALKRMKETNRYGVVIVLPDDPKEREKWGKALIDRYNEFNSADHEPFGVVVLICLTQSLAGTLLKYDFKDPKAVFTPNQFILSPDGRWKHCFKIEAGVLEDARRFSFNFSTPTYGISGASQLKAQAEAIEKTVPDATRKALNKLTGATHDPEAAATLLEKADAILPWIVYHCMTAEALHAEAKPPVRVALRTVLTQYWSRQSFIDADPCLPYGMKVEAAPAEDPCPPCGMAVTLGKARKFLSFYEK